jgi:hypothetical protein
MQTCLGVFLNFVPLQLARNQKGKLEHTVDYPRQRFGLQTIGGHQRFAIQTLIDVSYTHRFKEKPMRNVSSIAAVRHSIVPAISSLFIRRLVVSLLMTGADVGIAFTYAPSQFSDPSSAPALRAAFTILILGLAATLAHMWFLTYSAFRSPPIAI